MRHIVIILLALIAAPLAGAAPEAHSLEAMAKSADESYRQGKYVEAIAQYEEVYLNGYASADLYYNLGNAYYRDNAIGLAILNYERALRLSPNMTDAKENLALAESHTIDRIAHLPQLFIVKWVNALQRNITPAAWRTLWLILLAVLTASVLILVCGRAMWQKRTGLAVGIAALLLLVMATLLLISSTRRYNAHSEAIITAAATTVKSSPEQQSVDKMLLHEGTKVTITDSLSGWYKITIADGTSGWCQTETIERI